MVIIWADMGVTSMGVSGSWSLKWTGPIIQLISTWFSIGIFASTSSNFVTRNHWYRSKLKRHIFFRNGSYTKEIIFEFIFAYHIIRTYGKYPKTSPSFRIISSRTNWLTAITSVCTFILYGQYISQPYIYPQNFLWV